MSLSRILIIDYGSQLTQLIAKRIRELQCYSEIYPFDYDFSKLNFDDYCGIIFSGAPYTSTDKDAPPILDLFFTLEKPLLGICYGAQRLNYQFKGKVEPSLKREYGQTHIHLQTKSRLFDGFDESSLVLMSHSDHILKSAPHFKVVALSENDIIAALEHESEPWFLLQFHPEAEHTIDGKTLLHNFLIICKAKFNWIMKDFIEQEIEHIKQTVVDKKVLLALSGGVDSMVCATLLSQAIGDNLECVFVDHGLLRKSEQKEVVSYIKEHFSFKLHIINAKETFLNALKEITDPEEKRKIIGRLFIKEFEKIAKEKIPNAAFLAQGTIYPDVIESAGNSNSKGKVIKSHHNVGGLPEKLSLKIIEPLRMLFKDEVRKIGEMMNLPSHLIYRHPFPGPGLGVRILGEVKKEYIEILQNADDIFIKELHNYGLYHKVKQAFCVFLPVKSVGVMGDNRTYEYVIAIRCIDTNDFMTSNFSHLPFDFLNHVSTKIINGVPGVNRVVYDISNKPPATIEWE